MLIVNAVVCDVNGSREQDVRIEDGVIVELGKNLQGSEIVDAKGAYLLPALIDTNIRLQDSNLNAKNIQAIAKEAKKGGVGHIILNADSTPAVDNEVVLEFAQNGIAHVDGVKIDVMLNSLKEDMSLSDIAILLKKGAIVPYMSTFAKNDIAIKIAQYVQMYKRTLFCKAEDNSLVHAGVMLEGDVSSKLGLAGIPDLSEVLHVSRMIEIARHFKIEILFTSIASPRSIELISKAKKEGVQVKCEVSIYHLTHSDEACEHFNTTAKLNPPLSSEQDRKLLEKALQNGEIDVLSTQHQPNSPVNKEVAFYDAAYGCEGLGDALALYYTKLVKSGLISMQELVKLTVENPAKILGFDAGVLEIGKRADVILFDTNYRFTIENQQSLFYKQELFGRVI